MQRPVTHDRRFASGPAGVRRASRRSFVTIAVIVAFVISMALFGLWAKSAVNAHRRAETHQRRRQAARLAESGLRRAQAQRAADASYDGEVWSIPAAELGGPHAAEVRVRVTPNGQSATLRIEATAEFPVGAVRCAQVTKQIEYTSATSGDES